MRVKGVGISGLGLRVFKDWELGFGLWPILRPLPRSRNSHSVWASGYNSSAAQSAGSADKDAPKGIRDLVFQTLEFQFPQGDRGGPRARCKKPRERDPHGKGRPQGRLPKSIAETESLKPKVLVGKLNMRTISSSALPPLPSL